MTKRKKILKKSAYTFHKKLRAHFIAMGSNFHSRPKAEDEEYKKQRLLKEEQEKQQIVEAEQQVTKRKSKKSKLKTFLLFALNIIIVVGVLYYQISKEGAISITELLTFKLNYWFLAVGVLLYMLMIFLESLRFNLLIKSSPHRRSRPFLSYKLVTLGKYYDAITPMATGEQPFQMLYLSRRGLSTSTAISVPLSKYFITQLGWITINIFAVIYSLVNHTLSNSNVVLAIALTSFFLNMFLVTAIMILSVSKKFGKIAVAKILRFLEKIKLIKNYDKQYNKVMKTIEDYQDSIKIFIKNIPVFFSTYLLSLITMFINFAILFFIFASLVRFDPTLFWDIIVKGIMIEIATGIIPLPGGSGVNEISFATLFAALFTEGTMFWAIIFWRFINFYSFIFQGLGVIFYDYFIGNKKYDWQKKKWELENESIDFKNKQLENYKKKKRKKIITI